MTPKDAVRQKSAGVRDILSASVSAAGQLLCGAVQGLPTWPLPPRCLPCLPPVLQHEIIDLRRQVGEGRAAQLERMLAATREQLEDVRRAHGEMEEHAFQLDQQAEALAEQLLLSRRGSGPRVMQPLGGPRPYRS